MTQACFCPRCGKIFALDLTKSYLLPDHVCHGYICSGSGDAAKLVSAGLNGGPKLGRINGCVRANVTEQMGRIG